MSRRFVLVGIVIVVALPCFSTRARATGTTDVEVAGYEGQTSGNFGGCGPSGRVRYGGLAAEVRHSERRPNAEEGMGLTGVVGAAVEYDRVTVRSAEVDPNSPNVLRDTRFGSFLGGAHARVGYHFHHVGFEAGIALWSGFRSPNVDSLSALALPEAQVTLGPRDFIYAVGGVGVPQLSQTMRYGLPYAGLGFAFDSGARVETRLGIHRAGPDLFSTAAFRLDATWYVPLDPMWSLRAGLGIGEGSDLEREANLGLLLKL